MRTDLAHLVSFYSELINFLKELTKIQRCVECAIPTRQGHLFKALNCCFERKRSRENRKIEPLERISKTG
jgi:hypothetical protein